MTNEENRGTLKPCTKLKTSFGRGKIGIFWILMGMLCILERMNYLCYGFKKGWESGQTIQKKLPLFSQLRFNKIEDEL